MLIRIHCEACGKRLKIDAQHAGRQGKCPYCSHSFVIPATAPANSIDDSDHLPSYVQAEVVVAGTSADDSISTSSPGPGNILPRQSPPPPSPAHAISETSQVPVKAASLPPYLSIPAVREPQLSQTPELSKFQVLEHGEEVLKSYRIRVLRPKFPWLALLVMLVFWPLLVLLPFIVAYHFLRRRGHTFLYLTNRRLVIAELEEGTFGKAQTLISYSIGSISGFTLYTQRGLKKLLHTFTLKEKRTFYISVVTNNLSTFQLGSQNSMASNYDPGIDSVSLCGELDSLVLMIKNQQQSAAVANGVQS